MSVSVAHQGFGVLRRERRFLGWAVVLSIVIHTAGIGVVERLQPTSEEVAQRVLFVTPTVGGKFVMRTPRVTKRLELRKLPRERGGRAGRGVVMPMVREEGVVAKVAVTQAEAVMDRVVRGAGGIGGHGSRVIGVGEMGTALENLDRIGEVGIRMREVGVTKEPERRVDMTLEMLDVNSLDTGRYQAMVIRDPRDKQSLKGFLRVGRLYSESSRGAGGKGGARGAGLSVLIQGWENQGLRSLVQYLNYFTGLRVTYGDPVSFDDERLIELPWAMVGESGDLSETEMRHLARYLVAGGFLFGWVSGVEEGLIKYEGLVQGKDFYVAPVPVDHPIFHSFFDMDRMPRSERVFGLWVHDRLCMFGTGDQMGRADESSFGTLLGDQQRQPDNRMVQLAINAVVYALTQEGSITHQLMQTVKK